MAAKRLRDDGSDDDQDQTSKLKRMRAGPSFASVIREVVMKNFFDNMCSTLEPLIRKVVSEEVENRLRARRLDWIPRCPSGAIGRLDQNEDYCRIRMNLKLRFTERLSLPIFTGTKILDVHNNPLQIILDGHDHHQYIPPCSSIRVEILVLDGDFLGTSDNDTWTEDEFSRYIVRERTGKRPLIAGESKVNLWSGIGAVGDIEFTDNSSWIRSRRFRLGARVVKIQGGNSSQNMRIREAVTEPFVVKDHRGELYKKHHPPALDDEVWRLEKIGKGGAFHQKLASEGIHTVQDFLKLSMVDSTKLRTIMGAMSDRMWESTLKHAKTCVMGTKLYRCHGDNYILTINPICQLVEIEIEGRIYLESDFKRIQGAYVQRLVKDAYTKWNCLEEFDSQAHNTTQLALTHKGHEMEGDSYNCSEQMAIRCYGGGDAYLMNGTCSEVETMSNNEDQGEWALNSGLYIGQY
ncbi:protein SAR DEFICIENT 1-like isoform X2 [Primulina eburnea]|uniref:protein SAR DEFICIENT 1-like isoform X2 n=1 Tax=Primulina eburnea TaxID=1245227 RepID=UPI003C6CB728